MNRSSAILFFLSLLCTNDAAVAEEKSSPSSSEKFPKTECLPISMTLKDFHCMAGEKSPRFPCIDQHKKCEEWAKGGECKNNPQYMLNDCRKSCSSCIPLHPGEEVQVADKNTKLDVLKRLYDSQEYLHKQSKRNVETRTRCVNKHPECTHWASLGECKSNPQFMHRECSPACKTCETLVK